MSLGPLDSPTEDRPAMSYADVCAELDARPPSISMVVPALNEAENLVETIPQAIAVLKGMNSDYEVLVIDDGSTDGTPEVMRQLCSEYPELKSIRLRRNAGKAAALSIGFDLAKNDVLVMMDADGQDEPREIPALVAKLDEGFDLVTGRRSDRQDRFLKRHTSSSTTLRPRRSAECPVGISTAVSKFSAARSQRPSISTESSTAICRSSLPGPVSRLPRSRSSTTFDCTARPSTESLGSGEACSICAPSSSSPLTTVGPSTFSAGPDSCRH